MPAALAGWLRAEWNLILTDRIPQPEEVLRLQAGGRRPVTLVAEYPRLMQPVLEKPDGWAFLVHDLEHAFKFFHDPRMHAGQRRLFDLLFRALERGFFVSMRQDPIFSRQFDYLISDMNTHVIHSLRYLVAVLIDCCLRAEGKDSAASLSPAAEASLADFLAALAANWQLGVAAAGALQRLTFDRFSTADADIIERAILNP